MKKRIRNAGFISALMVCLFLGGMRVQAETEQTIHTGVYADTVELSGMTRKEAMAAVAAYVEQLKPVELTLLAAGDKEVTVTAGELGLSWANEQIVDEALQLGTKGNVLERYKILKDLEHENQVYEVRLSFDVHSINQVLLEQCAPFDQPAIDARLKREEDSFTVIEGQTGYQLDVETSIDLVYNYLVEEWDYQPARIALQVAVSEPRGDAQSLSRVKDVLGSFTTSYSTSGASRSANVENGCHLIDGVMLYPGDEFSTYETVSPFTQQNGYYMAGSYVNGKVVDSLGGGICQVSTTLYNAVLLSELEVTERHNHSMIVTYVDPSADAAIAESSGKDFKFVNNTDYPVYIEGYTEKKKITFTIYGCETRSAGHQVRYESEVLEVNRPETDIIYPDAGQPVGYISTSGAHIGYKARLWKIVTEDGAEVSREQINSSSYKMSPRSAVVGTFTEDPTAYEEIMAAIGTNSIDHVKNVIAILTTPPPAE
ncbi:MAG: VanW family protein [Roseburia sp.]|nr:VanW family protein [Roseburia sp.]